jgi:DNA recombination protein RmuC
MDILIPFITGVCGLAIGSGLVWLFNRGKLKPIVEAAVATQQAGLQSELTQLKERLRFTEANRENERATFETLRRQADAWRNELDASRDEAARLNERASRVATLEIELKAVAEEAKTKAGELLRMSEVAAEKTQAAALQAERVATLESEANVMARKLDETIAAYSLSIERRATLEEQVMQIPPLQEKERIADAQIGELTRQLADLRESSSSEISRLTAEVAAGHERTGRISTLERELKIAAEEFKVQSAEVLRLSELTAEKTQAVALQVEHIATLESQAKANGAKLDEALTAYALVNERRATLEEQVAQLPGLQEKERQTATLTAQLSTQLSNLRETSSSDISRLTAEVTAGSDALSLVRNQLSEETLIRQRAEGELGRLSTEASQLRARLEAEQKSAAEKLELLLQAKEALSDQFKSLANDILEEKSKRFADQNQVAIGQLLDPLKTQLGEFKSKVEEVYVQEGKDRSALAAQVKDLVALNQTLSQDAQNLTLALKGNAKTQGNWGELVLERVLEASGLRKGHEYYVQESQIREDGTRAQPDVVIHLPEERRLVVDAKVSLIAYEEHILAQNDDGRAISLRRHLDSTRNHIKGLSSKQYQALYGLKSLDFVLMFVPIEPAFMLAVTNDADLFMDAWEKNVLLVSPSTLLFVVRTVAHLWRQEAQSRNAQDIANRGAELYDRLSEFVKDLETVGNRLRQAQESYDSAHKRLSTGRGNVIRQAEMLRALGVKASKPLPLGLVETAVSEEDLIAVTQMAALAAGNTPHELS